VISQQSPNGLLIYHFQSLLKDPKLLIIFDRDGILNVDDGYSHDKLKLTLASGVNETFQFLSSYHIEVAIATNQSGISRGLFSQRDMEEFNLELWNRIKANSGTSFSLLVACPHSPAENCECRKPKTGSLEAILNTVHIPKNRVAFFGDKITDQMAGLNIGINAYLVKDYKLLDAVRDWIQNYDLN